MWQQLGSPPDNLRFYRFSELSNDKESDQDHPNLEQHRVNLFKEDKLSSVAEQSLLKTNGDQASRPSNQPLSSLKSNDRVKSTGNTSKTAYDLRLNCKQNIIKNHSKSNLERNKARSSALGHQVNQYSIKPDHKKSSLKHSKEQLSSNPSCQTDKEMFGLKSTNEHPQKYTDVLFRQLKSKHTQQAQQMMLKNSMLTTLMEIRDLTKENLIQHKKLIKMLEDKQQISFLYGQEQDEENRYFKPKRDLRKTNKRNPEKSSTIKKFGKSVGLEERVAKVEDRYRFLQKKLQKMQISNAKKTITLSRTNKKSTSTLR